MRALKAAVIIMGVMIVVGVVGLVVLLVNRAGRSAQTAAHAPAQATARGGFGHVAVELPPGATVAGMQSVGDRLVLRLSLGDGKEQLLVLDPARGTTVGTFDLTPLSPP